MKLCLLALITMAFSAQARQYIQCASLDSWDRSVINLDGDESTLFMTNGVHLPDSVRVLKDLDFQYADDGHHVYSTSGPVIVETIKIPIEIIDQRSQAFEVEFELRRLSDGYTRSFKQSCFSAIYP